MQVTCGECEKSINVPDEKVPKDQAFNLTCPSCKNKIRVDQHLQGEEEPEEEEVVEEPEETQIDAFNFITSDSFEEDEVLEIYDENDKVALVLDHNNEDMWIETLSGLDYKLQSAGSPEHAIHKLKFTEFDLVILNEDFGQVPLKENPVYDFILNLQMATRRKMFFALVGKEFHSTNNLEAYAKSANVVINEKDFEKVGIILRKTINENDQFYKVYKETLQSLGKV